LSVARAAQFGSQLAQFTPQFFQLLAEVGFVSSVRGAFTTTRVAFRMLAHQLLGPLPDFVGQIGEASRFEMPGGHLQMLGPFFRWQIALRTGTLRPTPLRTGSPEIGDLRTGALWTLRATGPFVGTARTVRAIPQLLQPALGFTHRAFHLFDFRSGCLPFDQLALPDAQFVEVPFDLLPLALAHLLHPPARSHPFGTFSRPPITGPPITGTTIARAPVLRTAPIGTPVLHPASFTGTAITRTTIFGSPITRSRSAIAWAALRTWGGTWRTAAVVNQLLLGSQLGFRPNPTGITRRILG
jgi:hypothetical protein